MLVLAATSYEEKITKVLSSYSGADENLLLRLKKTSKKFKQPLVLGDSSPLGR